MRLLVEGVSYTVLAIGSPLPTRGRDVNWEGLLALLWMTILGHSRSVNIALFFVFTWSDRGISIELCSALIILPLLASGSLPSNPVGAGFLFFPLLFFFLFFFLGCSPP